MATQKAQRIGIWIIAIVMTVGTVAGFVALILAPKNEATDQAKLATLSAEYQKSQDEYQKKVDAQAAELSNKYYEDFNQYSDRPGSFSKNDITALKTDDLKAGDGATIASSDSFSAYYIGWNPDGVVFDSSIDGSKLKPPILASPGGVIAGWTEGAVGMKIGGIRELTIPSDKAYGEAGSGDKIAPNTPLKFIIMIIPTPDAIPQAEIPPELLKYYTKGSF